MVSFRSGVGYGGGCVASGAVRSRSRRLGTPPPFGPPARSWMPPGLMRKRTWPPTQNAAPV